MVPLTRSVICESSEAGTSLDSQASVRRTLGGLASLRYDESLRVTVRDLATAYLADQKHSLPHDTYQCRARITTMFAESFGERQTCSLRPSEVKDWIYRQPCWRKDASRLQALDILKRMFNWGVEDTLITSSPIKKLSLPEGDPRRATMQSELQSMLANTDAVFRRCLIFMKATGCRPGETRKLLWAWVDFDSGLVIIPRGHNRKSGTKKKPRVIVMTGTVAKLLRWIAAAEGIEGHVFRNEDGDPWQRSAFTSRLRTIRKRAGLSMEATLHGIRHLFGTNSIKNGNDVTTTSKLMGHARPATTAKYYVHLDGDIDFLRAAAEKVSKRKRKE